MLSELVCGARVLVDGIMPDSQPPIMNLVSVYEIQKLVYANHHTNQEWKLVNRGD
jgi:hypothetical protein